MTLFIIIVSVIAAVLMFFLFMIAPSSRRHKDRELLRGMFIAHRGLHDKDRMIPENSLLAFRAAAEKGFAIENDIHITRDGEVVVFHDDDLHRMCGVHGRPEDMTLSELRKLYLMGTAERIPTLTECLETVDGRVPLLIEFKCKSGSGKELCEAANKVLSDYKGKYLIQSFYPPIVRWYKKNRKEICRGQLSAPFKGDKLKMRLLGCLIFNFLARPDFVSYEFTGANNLFRRICTGLGAFPVGWTFRSQQDLDKHKEDFETYIFEGFLPK
ncbi:MAG: glycerophosphodiester phosphodiesterase [Ruminococcaceae bacterium]|nr:glycerophosphodiester phosphodiesterase [Oscillospiraceae bacterium]